MAEPISSDMNLYIALISAGSALLGTVGGGLISFLTTYHLKKKEWQQEQVSKEIEKREKLYADFMAEFSRVNMLGWDSRVGNLNEFVALESILGRISLFSSKEVELAAVGLSQYAISRTGSSDVEKIAALKKDFGRKSRHELDQLRSRGIKTLVSN